MAGVELLVKPGGVRMLMGELKLRPANLLLHLRLARLLLRLKQAGPMPRRLLERGSTELNFVAWSVVGQLLEWRPAELRVKSCWLAMEDGPTKRHGGSSRRRLLTPLRRH